jgi:hypothetical protein
MHRRKSSCRGNRPDLTRIGRRPFLRLERRGLGTLGGTVRCDESLDRPTRVVDDVVPSVVGAVADGEEDRHFRWSKCWSAGQGHSGFEPRAFGSRRRRAKPH